MIGNLPRNPPRETTRNLTPNAVNVLRFVAKYSAQHGFAPSMREIGKATNITSLSVVSYTLDRLQQEALITKRYNKTRTFKLTAFGAALLAEQGLLPASNARPNLPPVPELAHAPETLALDAKRTFATIAQVTALLSEAHTLQQMTDADLHRVLTLAQLVQDEIQYRAKERTQ